MDRDEVVEKLVSDFKCSVEKFLGQSGRLSLGDASSQVLEMMQEHAVRLEQARAALARERGRRLKPEDSADEVDSQRGEGPKSE